MAALGRRGMPAALFLIGASLDPRCMRGVGYRPLALGVVLWIVVAASSLAWILIRP